MDALKDITGILREKIRFLGAPHHSPYPPSWQIDAAELRGWSVVWPRSYEWQPAKTYVESIRSALAARLPISYDTIPQGHGVVAFDFVRGNIRERVIIDYFDHSDRLNEIGLRDSIVYFKMQFREGGYPDSHVVPGGFVTGSPYVYCLLNRTRQIRDKKQSAIRGRYKAHALLSLP